MLISLGREIRLKRSVTLQSSGLPHPYCRVRHRAISVRSIKVTMPSVQTMTMGS